MIIERIDKSGHVIDCHAFEVRSVELGRSYESDIIAVDPYVDAKHARIEFDEEGNSFILIDLGSENGIKIHKKKVSKLNSGGSTRLASGDSFSLGKTRYRVLHRKHEVAGALKLSALDTVYSLIGTWWVSVIVIALALVSETWAAYLDKPYSEKLYKDIVEALYMVVAALAYGFIWIFIAKSQRHEGRFLLHTNMFILCFVVVNLYQLIAPVLLFNVEGLLLGGYLFSVISCVGLFLVLYVSCYQSTGLNLWKRTVVSLIPTGLILLGLVVSFMNRAEFSRNPDYQTVVVSPAMQWKRSISTESFIGETDSLYLAPTEEALERLD